MIHPMSRDSIPIRHLRQMDFSMCGYNIRYGEHTGVWWVDSQRGSLEGLQFRTLGAAIEWVEQNAEAASC